MGVVVSSLFTLGAMAGGHSVATASTRGAGTIRVDFSGRTWVHNDFDGDGRFDMGAGS